MEFDELSNRVTGNLAQDCWNRPMSSAFDSFVLFVSFVVTVLYNCESLDASLFSLDLNWEEFRSGVSFLEYR